LLCDRVRFLCAKRKTVAGRVVFMEGMRAHDQHSSRNDVAPLSLQPSHQPSQPPNWAADSRLMQTPHLPPNQASPCSEPHPVQNLAAKSCESGNTLDGTRHFASPLVAVCQGSLLGDRCNWLSRPEARLVCHKCATAMTPQFMAQVAALRNRSAIHTSLSTQSENTFVCGA
jgi:hypothetical protein